MGEAVVFRCRCLALFQLETSLSCHFLDEVAAGSRSLDLSGRTEGRRKLSFSDMAKKVRGKVALSAALATTKSKKHVGAFGEGGAKGSGHALAAAASLASMIKNKMLADDDDDDDEDDEDDDRDDEFDSGDEGGHDYIDNSDGDQRRHSKEVTIDDIRKMKAKMRSVSQIMIDGEDVEIGSDSDVSDTSQIWSDYGDEIIVDKGTKLSKWCPSGRVSQRLSLKERGSKMLSKKKKKKKKKAMDRSKKAMTDPNGEFSKPKALYSRESEAQLALQAMANSVNTSSSNKDGYSFVPTGPGKGSGSGIYFIDFSDDYKKCLKMAREKLEETEKLSQIEKMEMDWIQELKESRNKPLSEKLIFLKLDSPRMSPRSQSPRMRSRRERLNTEGSGMGSAYGSSADLSQLQQANTTAATSSPSAGVKSDAKKQPGLKGKSSIGAKKSSALNKGVEYDAMGSRWNKSMWDNMENYWRMIMSNEEFEVTPGCYDRQLDSNYRFAQETVTFAQLEEARAKCLKWIQQNKEHFSL